MLWRKSEGISADWVSVTLQKNFIIVRGDSRISMTIAKTEKTLEFGRENRFLIDDPASTTLLAYALTKPLKLGWSYNDKGVYSMVLQEVATTDDDNQELRIADYYKFFPDLSKEIPPRDDGRQVWL